MEPRLDEIGDGRFAGARKPGEPQHRRLLVLERGAVELGDIAAPARWTLVARRRPKAIMPAAAVALVEAVDQDEGAGRRDCRA